ncbi:MAG TPA: hypothetical protein VN612_02050 [Acidobacteriaceae bacterium]|nr:hypothetical protein [Acidobacteriaceae bacterium]
MSAPVDVLAVLDRACTTLNDEGLFNPGDDLCKARRAVAELIEAHAKLIERHDALLVHDALLAAAVDARFLPHYPTGSIDFARVALARVGG